MLIKDILNQIDCQAWTDIAYVELERWHTWFDYQWYHIAAAKYPLE